MTQTPDDQATVTLSLAEAEALSRRVLEHHGLSPDDAAAVSRTIVAGQRDDCQSHGLYRLLVCAHTLRSGKVATDAVPVITSPSPAVVRADARRRLCPARVRGRAAAVRGKGAYAAGWRRWRSPIACISRRCGQRSRRWWRTAWWCCAAPPATPGSRLQAAPSPCSAPTRSPSAGRARATPRSCSTSPPARWRAARSNCTGGRARRSPMAGASMPMARPPTMREAALAGAMLTFGGHKGSALSLMIELIAGPLIGDMTSAESMAVRRRRRRIAARRRAVPRARPRRLSGRCRRATSGARRAAVRCDHRHGGKAALAAPLCGAGAYGGGGNAGAEGLV